MLNNLQNLIATNKAEMNEATAYFFDALCDATDDEYLDDLRFTCFDNNVSIYYSDLIEWVKNGDNVAYMESCIEEGYFEPARDYDFYKHIQSAQICKMCNTCDSEKALETFSLAYVMQHYENVTQEQIDEIIDNSKWLAFTKGQVIESINEIMNN